MNFKTAIAIAISDAINLNIDTTAIESLMEIPSNPDMGDFAFPCFRFSKELSKAPNIIAQEIVDNITLPNYIDSAEVAGAYVNFYMNKQYFSENIIKEVLLNGDDFGKSNIGNGKTIVLDYSSPNIAKPFHVGHLRSTVIGNALYNIYNFIGYKSFSINYLGDWGTQFGKLIVAYKMWGSEEEVNEHGIEELTRIYVQFHDEAEKNPELNDMARNWLLKMQEGDPEALELWKWFKDISLKEFDKIYKKLDISFDSYDGESFFNDKMMPVVEEMKNKELLTESNGAQIVELEEFNLPPCLILRSDGGTLYPTRDIAAAIYRHETFDFEKCIIITAVDQSLHFTQFFKVIELMGYDWADKLEHVSFGLVSLDSGKLSTRKGHVVLMEELLDEAIKKTSEIIEEKNPALFENKELAKKVSEEVGIGAIIFNDLYNSRIKNVVFSWDKMLNFDGETGPYVQYAHARACSILRSVGEIDFQKVDYSVLTDPASMTIIKILYTYDQKIIEAAAKNEPYIITRQLVALAQSFNKYYNDNKVMVEDTVLKNSRACMVFVVKTVLASGLNILGIKAPTLM